MGLIAWFKEKIRMLFKTDIEKAFGVETYLSTEMDNAIKLWGRMQGKKPPWLKKSDGKTVALWNVIADELAKLVAQNIDVKIQGKRTGEMPDKMQKIMGKYFLQNARENIHTMVFWGGVMAKWNGKGIEFLRPNMFRVTEFDSNKDVLAAIFFSFYSSGDRFYTKAEWHRFEEETRKNDSGESETVRIYRVSTKAFVSDNQDDIGGREVPLKFTKWSDIDPEFYAENLEGPMFRYIKCPVYNTIDPDSPLGMPCFANCMEELEWLDIGMSTLGIETEDSAPKMIIGQSAIQYASTNGIELPRYIFRTGLDDIQGEKPFDQWQPTLQITDRKEGINFMLSIIGFKCGFDPGYFVFDGQNIQIATATQVRVTQKRTADTVLDYRDVLDMPNINGEGRVGAIHDIAYIINAMLVINGNIKPSENGNYEIFASFADLLADEENDKIFDLQLANNGYMAKWRYNVRHLGLTEEEAKQYVAEAQEEQEAWKANTGGLFGEE